MTRSSQSAPGQFAAAVRRADPRSRAATNPAVQESGIQHGHEHEAVQAGSLPQQVASTGAGIGELLAPGPPRNADGTERAD